MSQGRLEGSQECGFDCVRESQHMRQSEKESLFAIGKDDIAYAKSRNANANGNRRQVRAIESQRQTRLGSLSLTVPRDH